MAKGQKEAPAAPAQAEQTVAETQEQTPNAAPPQKESAPVEAEQPKTENPDTNEPVSLEDLIREKGLDASRVKIRTKVDGEEQDVPLEKLLKGYQTDQALTRRGQKIGEERKRLEELRAQLSRPAPGKPAPAMTHEEQAQSEDPSVQRLQQEIAELRTALQPTVYDANRNRVADELKEQGFPDFREYVPRIDEYVAGIEDPNLWAYYNTPEGAKAAYLLLKSRDLMERQQAPAAQKPATERPKPPIVKIPSSSGVGNGVVDDADAKYAEAFNKFRETGDQRMIPLLLQLKGLKDAARA